MKTCPCCEDVHDEDTVLCKECYEELFEGKIPYVTDSHLKPAHTGLTKRQRWQLSKTES